MKKKSKTIKRFEHLLKKDQDWDYCYLLLLEHKKIKFMLNYFTHTRILLDNGLVCRDLKICESLLNIILERDPITTAFYRSRCNKTLLPYINLRNQERFVTNPMPIAYLEIDLRYKKAWHLYNIIREYRMQTWWD